MFPTNKVETSFSSSSSSSSSNMVIALVLLAILFLLGFFNTLYHIPPKKLLAYLQPLFPYIASSSIASTKSSPTLKEDNKKNKTSTSITTSITRDKKELETVFATFDKNGDGYITRQELGESLRNIGLLSSAKEVDNMIEKLDINGDGLIDLDEFCKMYGSLGKREKDGVNEEEEDEEMELRDAFDIFDWDKDGLITVVELSSVLASLGMKRGISVEDCKEMIKKVDMDGDGMVNFEEFKVMMKSGGKLASVS